VRTTMEIMKRGGAGQQNPKKLTPFCLSPEPKPRAASVSKYVGGATQAMHVRSKGWAPTATRASIAFGEVARRLAVLPRRGPAINNFIVVVASPDGSHRQAAGAG